MTDQPQVSLEGISVRFGTVEALNDIHLTLNEGVTALLGVNGAGKSTLMSVASGSLRPGSGTVSLGGDDVYARRTRRDALRRVALMPQDAGLPSRLTAREAVEYLGWLKGLSPARARSRAGEVLAAVDLGNVADHKTGALSGGMLRRLALAQALVSEPSILLLDEPSTGLDPKQRRGMVDLLRGLAGVVLMSSHVVEDVELLASRTVVLHEGSVLFDGATSELAARGRSGDGRSPVESGFLAIIGQEAAG